MPALRVPEHCEHISAAGKALTGPGGRILGAKDHGLHVDRTSQGLAGYATLSGGSDASVEMTKEWQLVAR